MNGGTVDDYTGHPDWIQWHRKEHHRPPGRERARVVFGGYGRRDRAPRRDGHSRHLRPAWRSVLPRTGGNALKGVSGTHADRRLDRRRSRLYGGRVGGTAGGSGHVRGGFRGVARRNPAPDRPAQERGRARRDCPASHARCRRPAGADSRIAGTSRGVLQACRCDDSGRQPACRADRRRHHGTGAPLDRDAVGGPAGVDLVAVAHPGQDGCERRPPAPVDGAMAEGPPGLGGS